MENISKLLYNNHFSEPFVGKRTNETATDDAADNTYFVSFLLRDGKNKTLTATDITPKKRMVVNNNFSGDRMATNQTFIESGPSARQSPSHNVQLLNNPRMQAPNPPQSYLPHTFPPSLYPQKKPQQQQQKPHNTFN